MVSGGVSAVSGGVRVGRPGCGKSFHLFACHFIPFPFFAGHFFLFPLFSGRFSTFQYFLLLCTFLQILAHPCRIRDGQSLAASGSIRRCPAVSGIRPASPVSGLKAHLPSVWVHLGRFAGISRDKGVVVPPDRRNAPYGQKKGRQPNEK